MCGKPATCYIKTLDEGGYYIGTSYYCKPCQTAVMERKKRE